MSKLDEQLGRWRSEGLISAEQATAIRAFEEPETHRIPLVAEVLGYLGGSLALVAIGVLVSQYWSQMELWARLLLVAVLTIVFLAAGWWIRRIENPAVARLKSFLWALGTVGVGLWFGLLADGSFGAEEATVSLIAFGAAAVVATLLWMVNRSMLQQAALFGSIIGVAVSALGEFPHMPEEFFGLAIWAIGVAWALLAWGLLIAPERTGYVLGSAAMLIGAQAFAVAPPGDLGWGLLLGIVTAVALLIAAVAARDTILLGFGAAGIFIFVPQIIFKFFADTIGVPVALFLTGVALLGTALLVARLRVEVVREEQPTVAAAPESEVATENAGASEEAEDE